MTIGMLRSARLLTVCFLATGMLGCKTLGWGDKADESDSVETVDIEGHSVSSARLSLQETLQDRVDDAASGDDFGAANLVKREPYWFKEFTVYPRGLEGTVIEMDETGSRTVPYTAEVKLEKQRYTTGLHRKKDNARADEVFFRDSGMETISYELRNGNWVQEGSLFMASRVEEYINGEWVPIDGDIQRTLGSDVDKKGFFGRTWDRIAGD
jgi:hypothetical protein